MDWLPLIKGILPPVLIAIALISAGGNRLLPLAVAVGMTLTFVLLTDWPTLPHELWSRPDGIGWMFWAALAAMLLASLEHWRCLPGRFGLAAGIGLGGAAVWLVLQKIALRETIGWNVLHVGVGGLAVVAMMAGARRLIARSQDSPFFPAFALAILVVDAVVMTLGDSALFGKMCGACAAAVGAGIVTALWRKPFTMSVADGTWFGLVHGLFLLASVHLAGLSWPAALLAAVAPVLPLALPKSFAKERPKRWMLTSVMVAALPAALSILVS